MSDRSVGLLVAASLAAASMSLALPAQAQGVALPERPYGSPPSTSVGPVSPVTGYSEGGRGGTGGVGGGPSTSGTAAGAGTATGGNPSGYPDKN